MTAIQEEIIYLRRQGLSYPQIRLKTGCTKEYVGQVCRSAGIGGKIAEDTLTEIQVAGYVSQCGFDYVGGYQSARKNITVRCRRCGRTFERQFHIFRDVANGTWGCNTECPLCRQDRQRQMEQERQELKEHEARTKAEHRAKKAADLISRQIEARLAIRVCKNCGKTYCMESTGYNSPQYCSEKCMKRWAMRIKNDRRIRRMQSRKHDADITLEKLFERDNGICYLCGKPCSWQDVQDGNAGDTYPSIDHVKPLAKGGLHTWENIKLAHRRCNWRKRDTYQAPVM